MRKNIIIYLNGKREEISSEHSFMTVAEFLRYKKGLSGTKIVCSEGDCGACTILISRLVDGEMTPYKSLNSCISFLYLLDRCHLITVEGVGEISHMHPVQKSMVECHGAQCGYCTPGIVCALAQMTNDLKEMNRGPSKQKVKNYLSGNLCRCTGYEPIINAGMQVEMKEVKTFKSLYDEQSIQEDLKKLNEEVSITFDDKEVYLPSLEEDALSFKARNENSTVTSGATDLGVVSNKGKINIQKSLSLNNINSFYRIKETNDEIEFGSKVSLTVVEQTCKKNFPEFSNMLHIFASPQIKNTGTLVGNIVNASPISDTVPFLRVAEAKIKIASIKSERIININEFIRDGYKNLDLCKNELIKSIIIPKNDYKFKLYKVSVRKDLDISTVTFACRYKLNEDVIESISFAFGGVAAFVIRAHDLEKSAIGKKFSQSLFMKLSSQVRSVISPLSDHRGSCEYRYQLCENLLLKFYDEVSEESNFSFKEVSV